MEKEIRDWLIGAVLFLSMMFMFYLGVLIGTLGFIV